MNDSRYEVIIFWDKQDEIFVAEIPELPGCMAHGSTKAEAIQNSEAAISLWLKAAKEDSLPIPEPKGKLIYA